MAVTPTVMVVEDEPPQREVLRYNLEAAGYRVVMASSGDEAVILAAEEAPDVVILDWMLPGISGIEVCRQLRARREMADTPIIMLSARGEEADRVRGLDTGADDYVVKPYAVAELLARVKAQLRRARPSAVGQIIRHGDIELDAARHRVSRGGTEIHLGPTEFRLLALLIEHPGRVWTRDQLLDRVWGRDVYVDTRTVDVHVGRLRKALRAGGGGDPIRTVRGAGYALD
ncbi:MAG: phosphate regulon transcriptional regulatory protein PhoB [Alphaproteobacteria bacterium]|nr:MAG: phosphate regulon transcriptional regulatory protein PhoB [Alphaproteobacteria bacterium]